MQAVLAGVLLEFMVLDMVLLHRLVLVVRG
jgi:hypothetical protein